MHVISVFLGLYVRKIISYSDPSDSVDYSCMDTNLLNGHLHIGVRDISNGGMHFLYPIDNVKNGELDHHGQERTRL